MQTEAEGLSLSSAAVVWKGEGFCADVTTVQKALIVQLLAYLDAALHTSTSTSAKSPSSDLSIRSRSDQISHDHETDSSEVQMQAASAADIAISVCVGVDRLSALWDEVWPRYKAAGVAAMLLERLQPHILADHLQALAPEVMQVRICAKCNFFTKTLCIICRMRPSHARGQVDDDSTHRIMSTVSVHSDDNPSAYLSVLLCNSHCVCKVHSALVLHAHLLAGGHGA